jgi:hydrogenase expression/formation protein HypC
MCLGIPGQVVELLEDQPHLAKVDVGGTKRNINIGLVENDGVKPGDWVLIHMGIAMSIMDVEEARSTLEFLERLGQIDSTSVVS